MLKLSLSVRTLSTTSQLLKDGDMVQAIFLKKIREFAQKVAAGQLMRPAEVHEVLSDELNRVANKFHMENTDAVKTLPAEYERVTVSSAVQKVLDGKNLDELISAVKSETAAYIAQRKAAAEEETRRAKLRAGETVENYPSSTKNN
ncbi:unnamed protein product [Enterobius vermicularis]|uniref:ATP synthase-coupling factor 6, mitochondrial n=1 Tax=Enterobius vermicularis TaxID=51028 RepID=A0A0N4VA27_ENTVE|nr:unnamed protein product [Enterobius vermicularis]